MIYVCLRTNGKYFIRMIFRMKPNCTRHKKVGFAKLGNFEGSSIGTNTTLASAPDESLNKPAVKEKNY